MVIVKKRQVDKPTTTFFDTQVKEIKASLPLLTHKATHKAKVTPKAKLLKPAVKPKAKPVAPKGKAQAKCTHCKRPAVAVVYWDERPVCKDHYYKPRFSHAVTGTREDVIKYYRNARRPIKAAGLDSKLVLQEVAAKFYLFYNYFLDHPKFKPRLDGFTNYLATNFSVYMTYSTMGEARHLHLNSKERRDKFSKIVSTLSKKYDVKFDFYKWFTQRCADSSGGAKIARHTMWDNLQEILKDVPSTFLAEFCSLIFDTNSFWISSTSLGGKRWAKIAKVLYDYLVGDTTPIIFVDSAFGLQHNGNCHFDKVWATRELREILNANRDNKLHLLANWLSDETRKEIKWAKKAKGTG